MVFVDKNVVDFLIYAALHCKSAYKASKHSSLANAIAIIVALCECQLHCDCVQCA